MPSTVRALAAAVAVAAIATLSRANNVTIDDTNQLWTYTPTAVWGPISASKPCPSCQVSLMLLIPRSSLTPIPR